VGRTPTIAVPNIKEIKQHMHSEAEMAGKSLFYSGPGGYTKKAVALATKLQRKTLKDFYLDSNYPNPWQNDMDASKQWLSCPQALCMCFCRVISRVPSGVRIPFGRNKNGPTLAMAATLQ
jgi:hypothetical protein